MKLRFSKLDLEAAAHAGACWLIGSVLLAGCGASQTSSSPPPEAPSAAATNGVAPPAEVHESPPVSTPPPDVADDVRQLEVQATLDAILRVALAKNPDLPEADQRARAQRELAPSRGRLPDPEFEYQLWAQPLNRPWALDEAQMHMFGLSQTLPALGTLDARAETATAEARIAIASRQA